jgi:hypothetical protein
MHCLSQRASPNAIDKFGPIAARNGSWSQEIRWAELPGLLAVANRVLRDGMPWTNRFCSKCHLNSLAAHQRTKLGMSRLLTLPGDHSSPRAIGMSTLGLVHTGL